MKKIILFFGSFDPLHKGHISMLENAIKKVNADTLYIGLNKNSSKGKLTSLYHRKKMIRSYCKTNKKCKLLPFSFDYKNIKITYKHIFDMLNDSDKYYILIGQDQLNTLKKWYNYDLILEKFIFIVAKRHDIAIDDSFINDPHFIFIDHNHKNISSLDIRKGNYNHTNAQIANYILEHNLYLKEQIKEYLSNERYLHTISVANTALLINKHANLGLNKYVVEKAALLHDIAKEIDIPSLKRIIKTYYSAYVSENYKILHQYAGEYIAREKFYVHDDDILKAIRYHTTGRSCMSLLEKLIFVADKIEPLRDYDTSPLINVCLKDFNKGFITILKRNKEYLKQKKIIITNQDTIECFDYYL